jgi:hypothetical protein
MGAVYMTPNRDGFYAGAISVVFSTDGVSWRAITNAYDVNFSSVNGSCPIASDGDRLFVGTVGPKYFSAPLTAGAPSGPFTALAAALPANVKGGGSTLDYDAHYRILYSSNMGSGFWRLPAP